jgi:mRNA-degrading endonuclease RelE of RelBE toxin-antitoxin system
MSFSVIPTDKFKKEAKRLIKKFPSLKTELVILSDELENNPEIGTPLGNSSFKIRLAIKSKGKGKREKWWCKSNNLFGDSK